MIPRVSAKSRQARGRHSPGMSCDLRLTLGRETEIELAWLGWKPSALWAGEPRTAHRPLEGRGGFEPTTPGSKVGDPSAELAARRDQGLRAGIRHGLAVDQSRLEHLTGKQATALRRPSLRTCVETLDGGWSGRRESNPCDLLGRNDITPQGRANCQPLRFENRGETGVKSGWKWALGETARCSSENAGDSRMP